MSKDQDLIDLAADIKADPLFLAKPGIVDLVKWERHQGLDHLVLSDPEHKHTRAVFTLAAEISHLNFWMKPDGGWRPAEPNPNFRPNPGSMKTEPVNKAKARFQLDPPRHRAFESDSDWAAIKATLDSITQTKRTPGAAVKYHFLGGESLKIRHQLFKARAADETDQAIKTEEVEVDATACGSAMSTTTDESDDESITDPGDLPEGIDASALRAITDLLAARKFKYIPIPAYDKSGKARLDKLDILKGCLAVVDFTISHQFITGQGDLFFLELASLRKLREDGYVPLRSPKKSYGTGPSGGSKRKADNDGDGSPRKRKARAGE